MSQDFGKGEVVTSEEKFKQDIDYEKQPEKRQGAEPTPNVKNANLRGTTELGTVSHQDAADQKSAQDEE